MTTPPTLPIPVRSSPTRGHEHAWTTESRHATSEGVVTYVRCPECGTRRVDMQEHPQVPPAALSRAVTPQ